MNTKNLIRNAQYFLGSIVTFKNGDKQSEVIDGQQRLTTLLLMLRAFYDESEGMKRDDSTRRCSRKDQSMYLKS